MGPIYQKSQQEKMKVLYKSRQESRAIAVGIKITKANQAVFRSPL